MLEIVFKLEKELKEIRDLANRIHGRVAFAQLRETTLSPKAEEESQKLRLTLMLFERDSRGYIERGMVEEISSEVWELDRRVFEWVRATIPPPALGKELCRGIMRKATDMLRFLIQLYKKY